MATGVFRARALAAGVQALPREGGLLRAILPASGDVEFFILRFKRSNSFSTSSLALRALRSGKGSSCSSPPRIAPLHFIDSTSVLRTGALGLSVSGPEHGKFRAAEFSGNVCPPSSDVKTTPEDVLHFWFKGLDPENGVYTRSVWFAGGPAFDKECEKTFGKSLTQARTGALNGWMATVRGRLALVILLDQISRNVYRNSPLSFAQDGDALDIALDTMKLGLDKELKPWERSFLYMPLMHSENVAIHEIADLAYKRLADENTDNEELHQNLLQILEFERKHSAVIKKFGRYPSRNAIWGRKSTKEEDEFLASGSAW